MLYVMSTQNSLRYFLERTPLQQKIKKQTRVVEMHTKRFEVHLCFEMYFLKEQLF